MMVFNTDKRNKRDASTKADRDALAAKCKSIEYGQAINDMAIGVSSGLASVEGAGWAMGPAAAAQSVLKGMQAIEYIALDCASIPFEEIKEQLNTQFKEVNDKLDSNSEVLQSVYRVVNSTLILVDKTRLEMHEGFNRVVETMKVSKIKDVLTKIDFNVKEFNTLKTLDQSNFIGDLENDIKEAADALLEALFTICDQDMALPQFNSDKNAIQALYALFFGTQSYVSIMFHMIKQYSDAADLSYRSGDFADFNELFNKMALHFDYFRKKLVENEDSVLNKAISIFNEVKNMEFIKFAKDDAEHLDVSNKLESLKKLKKEVIDKGLPLIRETPQSKMIEKIFYNENEESLIPVPFLKWKNEKKVSYAVQYEKNGEYSRIGPWKEFEISDYAHPTLLIDQSDKNRLVFRKFEGEKPELVFVLPSGTNRFVDIHRDLYNVAESTSYSQKKAQDLATQLINKKASITAKFERGRGIVHAAANLGRINILDMVIEKDSAPVYIKDINGKTPLHVAAENDITVEFVNKLITAQADINARTFSSSSTPLHLAVRNDIETIALNLIGNENTDINAQDKSGFTALHHACERSNLVKDIQSKIISALLQKENIKVNVQSQSKLTPLHVATLVNSPDAVKSLLSHKDIDVNAKDKADMTPIYYASMMGFNDIVKLLISHPNINVNSVASEKNMTPLHAAILMKKVEVVETLLKAPATDIQALAYDNTQPIHIAASTGQKEVIEKLLNKYSELVNVKTSDKSIPLHLAVMHKDIGSVSVLVENFAWMNKGNKDGSTPLHLAASSGNKDIFQYLLDNGSKITEKDDKGKLPFHDAVIGGNTEIVQILYERDPGFLKALDYNQNSPFYYALKHADNDNEAMVIYFINKGFKFDFLDKQGELKYAPLHKFAMEGNLDVVKYLIRKKANTSLEVGQYNFFDLAVMNGHLNIVEYAVNSGIVKLDSPNKYNTLSIRKVSLCMAAEKGHLNILEFLDDKETDISYCNPLHIAAEKGYLDIITYLVIVKQMNINELHSLNQATPLCTAMSHHRLNIVVFLIDQKADKLKACGEDSITPIHLAIKENNEEFMRYLISKGVRPSEKDDAGNTPLIYSAKYGRLSIAQYLRVREQVSVDDKNNEGYTALHIAAENGHVPLVNYLLMNGADLNAETSDHKTACDLATNEVREFLQDKCSSKFRRGAYARKLNFLTPSENTEIYGRASRSAISNNKLPFLYNYRLQTRESPSSRNQNFRNSLFLENINVPSTLLLLDTLIRKITDQKIQNTLKVVDSPLEVRAQALEFTEKFGKLLDILTDNSEAINLFEIHSKIYKAIKSGNERKLLDTFCHYLKAYSTLNSREIEEILKDSSLLEVNDKNLIKKMSESMIKACK